MPAPEQTNRYQKAVLWMASGTDDYGQPKTVAPVEIRVRWITKRTQVNDPQGNAVSLDATAVVDRKISPGSVMWLGEYADFLGTGSGSASDDTELHEVKTYDETPDLKGRLVYRTVGLARYRDALPTLTS